MLIVYGIIGVICLSDFVNAGGVNSIPIISQAKSFVELCAGDEAAARRTQVEFTRVCPGASQITSFVYACKNDNEEATKIQKECGRAMEGLADGIPVVGHIKGGIHYAMGDQTKGDECMVGATKSTLVLAAGVATGGVGGGAVAAAFAGIAVGTATDAVVGAIDRDENGCYKSRGVIGSVDNVGKGKDVINAVFEGIVDVGGNAMGGATGPKLFKGLTKKIDQIKFKNQVTNACKETAPRFTPASEIKAHVKNIENAVRNIEKITDIGTGKKVCSSMQDNAGRTHVGFEKATRIKIAEQRFRNGNPDGFANVRQARNAATERGAAPTRLSNTVRNAVQHESWEVGGCAEHVAADPILASNRRIRNTATVRKDARSDIVKPSRGCDNCQQFNLGAVATDLMDDAMDLRKLIPVVPTPKDIAIVASGIAGEIVGNNQKQKDAHYTKPRS